ncbi:uncharacterized protein LOC119609034 [Lucilia sericata]|uniref:uncharacterized protein LOC119609034 n=1 Tax=Lucilia sericata TaxID=13632 RepID=UPI0018A85FC7|nr:uncharacterized protein LOC119609034 [Lucilia sericata]
MFTNWLTGTTGLTNSSSSSNTNSNLTSNRLTETNNHLANSSSSSTSATVPTASLNLLNSHNLSSLNANIMSTPPDIILEVGPAPSTVRFMAHGLVLGMHSGYLRSAIRLDERGAGPSSAGAGGGSNVSDIIVYLTNVTPEQFAPLLTYMYTGYLDLNVENIFGVLLATHVLHMPRALEICRSYLARAQTEGYFGTNNPSLNTTNTHPSLTSTAAATTSGKIIRPIPSKPTLTNFGFLPISHQTLNLNPLAHTTSNITSNPAEQELKTTTPEAVQQKDEEDDIEVDEIDKQSLNNENQIPTTIEDEDEDVEVFIDSNSEAEVVVETQIHKLSFKKLMENKKSSQEKETKVRHHERTTHHRKSSHHSKSERRRKGSSGLQVAKAPIPASQLDTSEANKVIIDVASCDGPVRFKRILNTAYGHKPDACNTSNHHSGAGLTAPSIPERSLQSVSLSFHQQMAKTISQQQQLQQAEESENSETSNGSLGATVRNSDKASGSRKIQSEVFVCVYCKHTFKSQYCYQKHAKRHLNPLTLQATCVPEGKMTAKEESSVNGELQITKHQNITATRPFYVRNSMQYSSNASTSLSNGNSTLQTSSSASAATTSDYLRREVRPLDMNVQYYPCKTCGCKFPSYYFVHKHRKMCHAEEEAAAASAAQQQGDNEANASNNSVGLVGSADKLSTQTSD